ncbi:unnamed protein product [Arabis nemorensis]|uniref:cellulase n=1 Tax=Arabis nemorensis TaxID=586526 RepID=A0A565BEB0_9BRAS|nr:unnamed protein product [Arabis nemorensis]
MGNSRLQDGKGSYKDLVGGYYDAGDAIKKFNFPMTMLSWSVIEYNAKYEAAGELAQVKELIKWGTADSIDDLVLQAFLVAVEPLEVIS